MMKNKEQYILAMNHIKFEENLKDRIIGKVEQELERKYIRFFPKTIISLACIQMIFCFFATNSVGYFMV